MERRVYPLPVSAEIPAEAIRYSDVRSRVEIASEVTPVVNFRNANVRVLYEDLSMSSKSVGRAIGISGGYAQKLLHRQGITLRDSNDPIYAEHRITRVRDFFADTVKLAEWNARVHTPEARRKQADSLRQRYETDPEFKSRQSSRIQKAHEANRINGIERRRQKAALLNEQERIQIERELQFARRLLKKPEIKMLSPRQRQVIELRFRTDGGPAMTLEQVGEAMGGLSRQAIQQYEVAALVKLGVLKKPRNRSSNKMGG